MARRSTSPSRPAAQAQDQEAWHDVQEALRVIAALSAGRRALFVDVAVLGLTLPPRWR